MEAHFLSHRYTQSAGVYKCTELVRRYKLNSEYNFTIKNMEINFIHHRFPPILYSAGLYKETKVFFPEKGHVLVCTLFIGKLSWPKIAFYSKEKESF